VAQLKAIEAERCTYTLTMSAGKYVTDSAEGIYLATLLNTIGIDSDDVARFRLVANDGANPGAITGKFLFGCTRYYFPNIDVGSMSGAKAVEPMLAYADSWREGGTCEADYTALSEGTCLGCCLGQPALQIVPPASL